MDPKRTLQHAPASGGPGNAINTKRAVQFGRLAVVRSHWYISSVIGIALGGHIMESRLICAVTALLLAATASQASAAAGEKAIGKCMRADCASMQQYCEESRSAGKTGTNCTAAGNQCVQGKGRTWHGTTAEGKKWSCNF